MKEIEFEYLVVRKNGHVFREVFTIEEIEAEHACDWICANNVGVDELHRRLYTGKNDSNGKKIFNRDIVNLPTFVHINQSSHEGYMDFDINEPRFQRGTVVYHPPAFVVEGNFIINNLDSPKEKTITDTLPLKILDEFDLIMNFDEWCESYSSTIWESQGFRDVNEWLNSDKFKDSLPWKDLNEWNKIEILGNIYENPDLLK